MNNIYGQKSTSTVLVIIVPNIRPQKKEHLFYGRMNLPSRVGRRDNFFWGQKKKGKKNHSFKKTKKKKKKKNTKSKKKKKKMLFWIRILEKKWSIIFQKFQSFF